MPTLAAFPKDNYFDWFSFSELFLNQSVTPLEEYLYIQNARRVLAYIQDDLTPYYLVKKEVH